MARAIKFNQTQIKIALGYATQTVKPSKIERTDPRAPCSPQPNTAWQQEM